MGGLTFPCSPSLMPSALNCLGARFLSLPRSLAQTLFSLRLLDFWTPPPFRPTPPPALSTPTSAPVYSLTRRRLVFTPFSCRKEKVFAAKNVHLCIRSEFKITRSFLWSRTPAGYIHLLMMQSHFSFFFLKAICLKFGAILFADRWATCPVREEL